MCRSYGGSSNTGCRVWSVITLLASVCSLPVAASDDNLLGLDLAALSAAELSSQHATADLQLQVQLNDSDQQALLQNNSLSNSVTGSNSIADNALAGANGISTVIQNTGNQVIIQGNTMVNVMINP